MRPGSRVRSDVLSVSTETRLRTQGRFAAAELVNQIAQPVEAIRQSKTARGEIDGRQIEATGRFLLAGRASPTHPLAL
jgi:hypothetical protein